MTLSKTLDKLDAAHIDTLRLVAESDGPRGAYARRKLVEAEAGKAAP